jgi:hypothetical protein
MPQTNKALRKQLNDLRVRIGEARSYARDVRNSATMDRYAQLIAEIYAIYDLAYGLVDMGPLSGGTTSPSSVRGQNAPEQ